MYSVPIGSGGTINIFDDDEQYWHTDGHLHRACTGPYLDHIISPTEFTHVNL